MSTPFQTADILIPSGRKADASSEHAFALTRLLLKRQVKTRLLSNYQTGPLPDNIRPVTLAPYAAGSYVPSADLTMVEYPIWFELGERMRYANGTRIFWYQGVTPPHMAVTPQDAEFMAMSSSRATLALHAHLAVAASPYTADELHRNAAIPHERIRIVPYSVDTTAFSATTPAEKLDQLRTKWRLDGKRIVLYVGRVAGNKRIDLLIEAMAQLYPQYPSLHLLIVGDTDTIPSMKELTAKLRNQVTTSGLDACVTFTGHQDPVRPFFELAELYSLPSQHEGFGVPLIEAMAAGVPIVASASGSMPWVLAADQPEQAAGLTFESGNAVDLANQLRKLLDDPSLRQTMIERGARRVQEFTPEKFEQRAWAVIEEAAELAKQPLSPARVIERNLYYQADVALHGHKIRSSIPLFGPLIAWIRRNSTSHLKEAYFDRILARQIDYNRSLVDEISRLQEEIARLRAEINTLDDRK